MYVPESQMCTVPNSSSPWTVNTNGATGDPSEGAVAAEIVTGNGSVLGGPNGARVQMNQAIDRALSAFLASNTRTPSDFPKVLDVPPVRTTINDKMATWDSSEALNAVCQESPDITSEVHTAATLPPTSVVPWCGLNKMPIGKQGTYYATAPPRPNVTGLGWLGVGIVALGAYLLFGDNR